jgi:hypothetical protein
MPDARVSFALRLSGPLVAEQDGTTMATVADFLVVPLAPVQLKVYVVAWVSAPVAWAPLVGFAPVHAPEAVHELALVADQLIVVLPPLLIEPGVATKVIRGPEVEFALLASVLGFVLTGTTMPVGPPGLDAPPDEPHAARRIAVT